MQKLFQAILILRPFLANASIKNNIFDKMRNLSKTSQETSEMKRLCRIGWRYRLGLEISHKDAFWISFESRNFIQLYPNFLVALASFLYCEICSCVPIFSAHKYF